MPRVDTKPFLHLLDGSYDVLQPGVSGARRLLTCVSTVLTEHLLLGFGTLAVLFVFTRFSEGGKVVFCFCIFQLIGFSCESSSRFTAKLS